jgi:hypothetical protein
MVTPTRLTRKCIECCDEMTEGELQAVPSNWSAVVIISKNSSDWIYTRTHKKTRSFTKYSFVIAVLFYRFFLHRFSIWTLTLKPGWKQLEHFYILITLNPIMNNHGCCQIRKNCSSNFTSAAALIFIVNRYYILKRQKKMTSTELKPGITLNMLQIREMEGFSNLKQQYQA